MATKKVGTTKKAVTLLTRIESLLSDALDECSAIEKSVEKSVRGILLSAQESIASAKDYIAGGAPSAAAAGPKSRKKTTARAGRRSSAPASRRRAARA